MTTTQTTQPAPRRRDPEGRRRAILTAATEIIVERGSSALTHRAVATRAGVSLGSTTQYFSSIDDLRECALQQLADEIDESLELMRPLIDDLDTAPERAAEELQRFLLDRRAVHAEVALISAGATDPLLRALALRWSDRLIEMLAERLGRERAAAINAYIDGATVHAALHDTPPSASELATAIRALAGMPDPAAPVTG